MARPFAASVPVAEQQGYGYYRRAKKTAVAFAVTRNATAIDISTLRPIATSGVAARMMGIERANAQAVSDPDQRQKVVPLPECDRRSLSCHFVFYYMNVPCVKIRSAIWPRLYYTK